MSLHDAIVTVHHVTGKAVPDGRGTPVTPTEDLVLKGCNVQPVDTLEIDSGTVSLRLRISTAVNDPHDEITAADTLTIPGRSGTWQVDGDVMTYQHIRPHTEFYVKRVRR